MRTTLLLLLSVAACSAQSQSPCATPAHRQFDGILGEWEVREAGVVIGHARFRAAVHGCAIVHDFVNAKGEEGKGLLFLDGQWSSIYVSPGSVRESRDVAISMTRVGFTVDNRDYRKSTYPQSAPSRQHCDRPEHHAFDFWEGKWDVFSPRGAQTGTNHIYKAASGCALMENWTAADLNTGISINFWHAEQSQWRQVWVAPGSVLRLAGRWDGGALRLLDPRRTRLSFTPNLDGTVRQYWEQSADGAKTWSASFDGTYRRAKEPTRDALISALARTAAGADPAVETYIQSRVTSLAQSTAFDPGFVEPFLGRLTQWKPPASATGDARALRAQTIELARSHPSLRGPRSPHPVLGTNLDAYQWLALAAEFSRRAMPSPWRAWQGTWAGDGTFQGKAARIDVTIQPLLGAKFDELIITVTPVTGEPFLGRAVYAADGGTAQWHDSMANAYPIKAEWDGEKLVALWAEPVRGRSTYAMLPNGQLSITDEVLQKGNVFLPFARYTLSRPRFR